MRVLHHLENHLYAVTILFKNIYDFRETVVLFTLAHLMHYTHMKLYIYNRKGKWEEKAFILHKEVG